MLLNLAITSYAGVLESWSWEKGMDVVPRVGGLGGVGFLPLQRIDQIFHGFLWLYVLSKRY